MKFSCTKIEILITKNNEKKMVNEVIAPMLTPCVVNKPEIPATVKASENSIDVFKVWVSLI